MMCRMSTPTPISRPRSWRRWIVCPDPKVVEKEYRALGPVGHEERWTLLVFAVTALLWITRKEPLGGWSGWLGLPAANDASVGLLGAVALGDITQEGHSALLFGEILGAHLHLEETAVAAPVASSACTGSLSGSR